MIDLVVILLYGASLGYTMWQGDQWLWWILIPWFFLLMLRRGWD